MMRGLVRWSCVVAGVVLYVYADEIAELATTAQTPPASAAPPGSPTSAVSADCECGHGFAAHMSESGCCLARGCDCARWRRA